jgi:polyferredoxin
LIRYDSIEGIEKRARTLITPRSVGYALVLIVLVSVLTYFIATRSDIDVTILRTPGMYFQEQPDNYISNLYDVKATNKTFASLPLSFRLRDVEGSVRVLGDSLVLTSQEATSAKLFVLLKRENIRSMNTPLNVEIYSGERLVGVVQSSFLGPVRKKEG